MTRYEKHTPSDIFILELHDDGTLTEYARNNPDETWGGTWRKEWHPVEKEYCFMIEIGPYQSRIIDRLMPDGGYFGIENETTPLHLYMTSRIDKRNL